MQDPMGLSKRERQIMEAVYARGEASANDVVEAMTDPPGRTAVRTFLRILEDKGHLTHKRSGKEYIFKPTRSRGQVGKSVLRGVLDTFFGGSMENALAAHLADPKAGLSADELQRLRDLIEEARVKGSQP